MKMTTPLGNSAFEIKEGEVFSLVIENKALFRSYIEELYKQSEGADGKIVLSENGTPVSLHKNVNIIDKFIPFSVNTKQVLSGICSALEKRAEDEEHFLKTSQLMADIENYISELCFDFPFRTECTKLTPETVIKALHVSAAEDYESLDEAVLYYMSLVTEFDGRKLFVFINMRSFFSDSEMRRFAEEVRLKQMYVLLIESHAYENIEGTERLVTDEDLCEF